MMYLERGTSTKLLGEGRRGIVHELERFGCQKWGSSTLVDA